MNQLDAVASESYQLQQVTLEQQETEIKVSSPTDPEVRVSETGTQPENSSEKYDSQKPTESLTSEKIHELHSEEEDKFSDFDPTSLPEPDPDTSLNSCQTETIAKASDDLDAIDAVKGNSNDQTDDYMSDVSSGEDFLSATHDQSGLEDGEVSEPEEAISSKPSESNDKCDTAKDAIVNQKEQPISVSHTSPGSIDEGLKNEPKLVSDNKAESSSGALEKTEIKDLNPNILVDNASPIDYEDLESLEDFDQDVVTEKSEPIVERNKGDKTEPENTFCNRAIGEGEKLSLKNDCKESVTLYESAKQCANLNPEPIDSSPDLLNNCEEEVTDNISSNQEDIQNKANFKGKSYFDSITKGLKFYDLLNKT